ncbi:MAG: hypothetical protein ACD_3C00075G0001 [uncultured bacterium (gcode 4)]|uniref:Fibrinogen C-terminal domain-containing protein n=1 Tax=uncultured bacterium (gcode 4) TaxID=1234023 RepID=K2FZC1_9BACT|nr:MAG: hypothetical protein ACD_3C00075G0001 [uncultured bacterium (gcode 4)]
MSNTKNKKHKLNTNAFTLVELIVVIVILAILATIAFLSFSSQSWSARDSTRLADISSIKKSVEMYNVNSWLYPSPDWAYSFTYSGWTIWNQWKMWDSAYKLLQKTLSKKVKDPLKDSEYDYSLASNKREYQVAWNFEHPTSLERNYNPFDSSALSPQLSALWWTWTNVYISWNYNGVALKVQSWSTYYFIPTPTLFWVTPTNQTNVEFNSSFSSWTIILPWINNFANYNAQEVFSTARTNFSNNDIVNLMSTIQRAYSGSNISTPEVQAIIGSSWSTLADFGIWFVKNNMGAGIGTWWKGDNCSSTTYSGYTISEMNDLASMNFTKTISNGIWDMSALCSDWMLSFWIENINCNINYVVQAWSCVQDQCTWTAPDFSVANWTQKIWISWTYNSSSGQCTFVCQSWYYWNGASCTPASAWNYVPNNWATSQTACFPWTYQPLTWQSSCIVASAWNYVSATWQSMQIAVTTGQYQDQWWQTTYKSCTNKPSNSAYSDSTGLTGNSCPYSCTWWWTWSSCNNPPLWDMSNPWAACNLIKSQNPAATDWVYWIKPGPSPSYQVYCNMTTDWGGWTRIAYWSKANGSTITLGTAWYSWSPTWGWDFSIWLTNYNELIASQGNTYVQIWIKWTDFDGIPGWEIGWFQKWYLTTNEIWWLQNVCSTNISTEQSLTYSIYNGSKITKRGWSTYKCHHLNRNAAYQYWWTRNHRFYFYFTWLYNDETDKYSDAEIYIR